MNQVITYHWACTLAKLIAEADGVVHTCDICAFHGFVRARTHVDHSAISGVLQVEKASCWKENTCSSLRAPGKCKESRRSIDSYS